MDLINSLYSVHVQKFALLNCEYAPFSGFSESIYIRMYIALCMMDDGISFENLDLYLDSLI
jgi:hypothetical protein